MKEAIILAGGMGTRLREVVSDVPKPMAPVNGKPFLYYLLLWLDKYDISKAVISTGYKSDTIISYFGDSFKKILIEYAIEDKPLGTGGAIRYALNKTTAGEILIVNGDTYFPIDIDDLYSFHSESNGPFSVALKRMKNFSRYGSVDCEDNTILKFNEKKFCPDGYINGGIYLADRKFLKSEIHKEVFSLEKELLEKEAGSGKLKCKTFNNTFIDIGIPEDYHRAQSLLKNVPKLPDT
ncbi:MAG: nucleotidyltransferase family protein [Bacteroidales bacterium]|nr:nucleotidyltransferase family protein [Bacteroidales bacterium]